MIRTALEFVKSELSSYCFSKEPEIYGSISDVINVSGFYSPSGSSTIDLNKHLQLTLLNLEEERLEASRPYYVPKDDRIAQLKAPVTLNIYLLFVATSPNYLTSLHDLSNVIGFFQVNPSFHKDKFASMNSTISDPLNRPWRLIERLDFNIHSLTLEQQNNVWAALGTKHLPHIMYKVRMLSFFDKEGEISEPIVEVGLESSLN
ncbi:MAG: Pvc16 family protein [Leadbetterella sp.]